MNPVTTLKILATASLLALIPIAHAQEGMTLKTFDVEKAKQKIADDLRDPDSAKFRKLFVSSFTNDKGVTYFYLCGEINAKNAMGGYVGYRNFAAYDSGALMDLGQDTGAKTVSAVQQQMFDLLYPKACSNKLKAIGK
jgi:hypothetical protein